MGMFGFLPNNLFTNHIAQNTVGLSPRIWKEITGSMMAADGGKRLFLMGDDFGAIHHAGTLTDLYSEMPYVCYATDTSNHTIVGAADEKCGAVQLNIDSGAAGNEEIGIEAGDGTQQLGQISDTAADAHLTAFECRIKKSSIADAQACLIAGLASPGTIGAELMVDTTGVPKAASAWLGFSQVTGAGETVNFTYQTAAGTHTSGIAGVHTLVADAYVNLGFVYNPAAPESQRIKVFANNVENATKITATNIAAAAFPDAEALTAVFGMKGITGSLALEMGIDFWAFAQVI